jgi:hypothetical protein
MPAEQKPDDTGETIGCLLVLALVGAIIWGVYHLLFVPDSEKLANKYAVPVQRVTAPAEPHGCAFSDAPIGNKHCHYDKHVYVYDKWGELIEKDRKEQSCSGGCGHAWSVEQRYEKVEE